MKILKIDMYLLFIMSWQQGTKGICPFLFSWFLCAFTIKDAAGKEYQPFYWSHSRWLAERLAFWPRDLELSMLSVTDYHVQDCLEINITCSIKLWRSNFQFWSFSVIPILSLYIQLSLLLFLSCFKELGAVQTSHKIRQSPCILKGKGNRQMEDRWKGTTRNNTHAF